MLASDHGLRVLRHPDGTNVYLRMFAEPNFSQPTVYLEIGMCVEGQEYPSVFTKSEAATTSCHC
jgi:hypothetical protein